MREKKAQTKYLWIGLGVLAVTGLILYFVFFGFPAPIDEETPIPGGTSQGGLDLSGCVLDRVGGECLSIISSSFQLGGPLSKPNYLSTILIAGGVKCYGVSAIRFYSTLTKQVGSGGVEVPSISVSDILGITDPSSPNFQTAIDSQMTKIFTLGATPDEQQVDVDTTGMAPDTIASWTEFLMKIVATYKDATGGDVAVSPLPQATLNVRILPDYCDDAGTEVLWDTCSPNKPNYCQPGVVGCEVGCSSPPCLGTPGTLIEKASICGCPPGYSVSGETCVLDTCSDPGSTPVGECVSPAPLGSLQSNPTANLRFCKIMGQPLIEDCTGPDGVENTPDDCGCANDYYDGAPLECGVDGFCQYTTYTGDIGVGLAG